MVFLRPDDDSVDGNWLNQGGSNTNLFASIDEDAGSLSDADYIQSPANPTNEACKIRLSDPAGALSEPFTVRYRFNNAGGAELTVRLLQGTTEIASWIESGSGWTTQARTLTTPQFVAMGGDYTNLFLEFIATSGVPGRPLNLDFTTGNLDSRVTLTRSTIGTYIDIAGVLQTAAIDVARFDYDITSHAPRGLLLEEYRANFAIWNRDLTNVAWVKTNITAVKDQTGIDAAANSASKITATAANGTVLQSRTAVAASAFYSAYVKRITGSGAVQMTMDGGTTWTTVTVTSGWTRVVVPTQSVLNPVFGFRLATSGDAIAVDYTQYEEGTGGHSSAIATTSVGAERYHDIAVMTGTNFSSWFDDATGTFVIECATFAPTHYINVNQTAAAVNNRMALYGAGVSLPGIYIATGGADQANITFGSNPIDGTYFKLAMAFAANDIAGCVNGGTVATDATATLPTVDKLNIGSAESGSPSRVMWVKQVQFYDSRKSNAELQTLTA